MESKEISIVKAFIKAINSGDVSRLAGLMSDDHTFIDSRGTMDSERESLIKGWQEYFRMFPDYLISVEQIVADGNLVAAFGFASGTYKGKRGMVRENRIEMPAAWKAVVQNGKIKLWQVYADWSEGIKIIEEDNAAIT